MQSSSPLLQHIVIKGTFITSSEFHAFKFENDPNQSVDLLVVINDNKGCQRIFYIWIHIYDNEYDYIYIS